MESVVKYNEPQEQEMNDDSKAVSSASSIADEESDEETKIDWEKRSTKPISSKLLEDISLNFMEPEYEYVQNITNIPGHISIMSPSQLTSLCCISP